MPAASPGTKVVVHTDNEQRLSWELKGENGWYVGPAMDHYRCVTCYFPRTRTTRTCETVTFFSQEIPFPQVTLQDHMKKADEDNVTLITQPPSSTFPSLSAGGPVRNALLETKFSRHRTPVGCPEAFWVACIMFRDSDISFSLYLTGLRSP